MAKWRFELRETIYHTYEVELPDEIDEFEAEEYFYDDCDRLYLQFIQRKL